MLVITRREGEKVTIGDDIVITYIEDLFGKIRLGIDAPKDVPILRNELIGKQRKIKGVGDEPSTIAE